MVVSVFFCLPFLPLVCSSTWHLNAHIWWPFCRWDTFYLFSLLLLKTVLSSFRVFISLTEDKWFIYSCGVRSDKPMLHLLSSYTSTPLQCILYSYSPSFPRPLLSYQDRTCLHHVFMLDNKYLILHKQFLITAIYKKLLSYCTKIFLKSKIN